tara:strand:- start:1268 stop:1939 length:672 start_codon:yes stop_codon:yes gene_type:complete
MLHSIAPEVWEYERRIRIAGIPFPRRTTVVRLPSGGLWVHNVNALDEDLARELEVLGPVQEIVAPNKFHHFFVPEWCERFPTARLHLAPGLAEKKPNLPPGAVIGEPPETWGEAFEALPTAGHPALEETVFFHAPSKTLIVTDWVFHIGPDEPFATRTLFRLNGCYRRLRPSRLFRALAKDRTLVRKSTEQICERWPFERITMAHGLVTEAGPSELRAAFADF